MKDKETEIVLNEPASLISNEYYYKYIFKKTEKIVCAVFFILANKHQTPVKDSLVTAIEQLALETLTKTNRTLALGVHEEERAAKEISHLLIELMSKLRVLHAAGVLVGDHLSVFEAEIDAVLRSARSFNRAQQHTEERSLRGRQFENGAGPRTERRTSQQHAGPKESTTSAHESALGDRRARITAVLKAQGEASIKDISDTVTDCSEKTIQRELNALIKDGHVLRTGERRWSKYSLIT